MGMFCYQCEQTAQGKGCAVSGVCGKLPDVADLQDVLFLQAQALGFLAHGLRKLGKTDAESDRAIIEALFVTVTNVDFDPEDIMRWIKKTQQIKERLKDTYEKTGGKGPYPEAVTYVPAITTAGVLGQAAVASIKSWETVADKDTNSLHYLLMLGLKGMAAYADHAALLGAESEEVYAFFAEALAALCRKDLTLEQLLDLNMRCGKANITCMGVLSKAHTDRYGHPEPTVVSTAWKKGPAIVVTGHDLLDLEHLLIQTEGKGINIYTHGEMLPAHGYPGLKKYKHLAGHFGTAWQNQQKEFDGVPAAFLFTTNCIQKPRDSYKDNVFTSGLVAWPGTKHVDKKDFSPVIEKALALGGLSEKSGGTLLTGCGHHAVLGLADKVIAAVKAGKIRHFYLVGGCDGAKPGRNYYTEFVQKVPKDCVVMTLACGKFRFNDLDLGTIEGIPRLLDIGQCNDAYSAVVIAQALADAFKCGVNDLPLSLILSWYEQKAVVILLSLLSLGIKRIKLGPTLPAFLSPNIVDFLVKNFEIAKISDPEQDLAETLA